MEKKRAGKQSLVAQGKVCTVRESSGSRKVIVSVANPPAPKEMPTSIIEVLQYWGQLWMWSSFRLIRDDHWLEEAIEAGT